VGDWLCQSPPQVTLPSTSPLSELVSLPWESFTSGGLLSESASLLKTYVPLQDVRYPLPEGRASFGKRDPRGERRLRKA
jgi:hypothetical protein